MKSLLFFLFSVSLLAAQANTYYFSTILGNDLRKPNQAQNSATPWKTLNKLNSYYKFFKDGDILLFKRGEVFEGSIMILQDDKKNNPSITFGSFGTGAKPVITGLQTISGWKSIGGGIYEIQNNSFPDTLNLVLFDGKLQPMGRWPKVDAPNNGYLTLTGHTGTSSITSKEISTAKSFIGGELVIRKLLWVLDRGTITNQTSNTINYVPFISPSHPNYTYEPTNQYGFFFQNHVNTLTSLGDWCYDPATKKIKMFFGTNTPGLFNVKVPLQSTLVDMSYGSNITFNDISFKGSNSNTFNILYSTNIKINNCDIDFSGVNAINVVNGYYHLPKGKSKNKSRGNGHLKFEPDGLSNNIKVTNSTISNSNNNAIDAGNANDCIIQNNTIRNTGMIRGMGGSGDAQYNAIQYVNSNSLVEYNKIINTGYIGIHFIGDGTIIKNNYIDSFCMVKSDGGGIYTFDETGVGRKVVGNIVSNGIGDLHGLNNDFSNPFTGQVHGIYMDANSNNVTIENNTSFGNAASGLFFGSAFNMYVSNNLFYNNQVAQIKGIDSDNPLSNVNITNNILVARDSAQLVMSFVLRGVNSNPFYNIGVVDYNYYCRPLYEPEGRRSQGYPNVPTFYNYPAGGINEALDRITYAPMFYSLDTWKTSTGWDEHSLKSSTTIDDLRNLRFEYNPTNTSKSILLDGAYVDVKNKSYRGLITLAPFTSIILLKKSPGISLTNQTNQILDSNPLFDTQTNTATITAFPNPSRNTTTIQVMPTESGVALLEVFNQNGKLVKRLLNGTVEAGARKNYVLSSSGLPDGVYVVRFISKAGVVSKKITLIR